MDERFQVPGVDASTALFAAAPALLLAKAEPLFELEESAAGGSDMDAVHDMRVASRRLRESMRLLGPLYPRRDFDEWYRRVRRVTRALGPVRDSDVFIDAFSRLSRGLEAGGKRAVAFLVGYRMGQRIHELALLQRVLGNLDLAENRRSLAKLAKAPKRNAETRRPLNDFAHAAVAERLSSVYSMLPAALDEANIETQHALRIAFKRLRYAVEVFAPCYGEEFDSVHETLTAFQDELGDMHDLHIFLDMLRDPERVAAARRGGVTASDLHEVEALLERRAHRVFGRFAKHAAENPASALMPALLLPLSQGEPVPADIAPQGGEPETPQRLDEALAVVVETDMDVEAIVEPMPAVSAVTDFAGVTIESPVVVGAEPWAVSRNAEPAPAAESSSALPADPADAPADSPVPPAALEEAEAER